jgi:hypothetical protein
MVSNAKACVIMVAITSAGIAQMRNITWFSVPRRRATAPTGSSEF